MFNFLRITSACCIGLFLVVILIQQDPWFLGHVEKRINQIMSQLYGGNCRLSLQTCNLITGTIVCRQLQATAVDGTSWSWNADKAMLEWSWLDLLGGKKCEVKTTISDVVVYSTCQISSQGINVAILPHILLLLAPTQWALPFVFNQCSLQKASLHLCEPLESGGTRWACKGVVSLEVVALSGGAWISVFCDQGTGCYEDRPVVHVREGKGRIHVPFQSPADAAQGVWNAPISLSVYDTVINGKVRGEMRRGAFEVSIKSEDDTWEIKGCMQSHGAVHGEVLWCEKNQKKIFPWHYESERAALEVTVGHAALPDSMQAFCSHATCTVTGSTAAINLYGSQFMGELAVDCMPFPHITKLHYSENGVPLVNGVGDHQGLKGTISWESIQYLLKKYANLFVPGQGKIDYQAHFKGAEIYMHCSMADAHIRIPSTYNLIQGLTIDACVDIAKQKVTMTNARLNLHKGAISCSSAQAYFDTDGTLRYAHVPLLFQRCLLGWKKDLFAHISGYLDVIYNREKQSKVNGAFSINQAHIRGNILSTEFQQDVFSLVGTGSAPLTAATSSDWMCDVTCITQSPIAIKTPFLEAAVLCRGSCKGPLTSPITQAKIDFMRGTLQFPYRPLFINKGSIEIRPEAPDDPLVEMSARNHIKKYDVELAVSGSVQSPSILFSSSPSLEQAQIITLLLGGSEDGSLYFLMPKVMTETLESLLFGSSETTVRVQKYLKSLFHPLKNVSITPRLNDQAGRGGVRGSLELEVNERLRCVIEKNMSLPEDTTFEVAYDISDDTTIRTKRDERGDLGIEGEMRWKF